MAFKGITFAGQNVTPKNDGGLYQAHYGDGILWGCSMSLSGDDLVIQSGEFIAGGRVCQVDGATNFDLSTRTLTNGYIQVVLDFDMSKPEGMQWNPHTPLSESATTTFPALTQDDINDTGTLYQVELAVVQISGGNLTSVYSTMQTSSVIYTTRTGRTLKLKDDDNGNPRVESFLADGTRTGGIMFVGDGRTVVYGESNSIILRPNGAGATTGEMGLLATGEQWGGRSIKTGTGSTSSITQNTLTTVRTITGLDASGIYLLHGRMDFTPASSTGQWVRASIGHSTSASGQDAFCDMYRNATVASYANVMTFLTGYTTYYLMGVSTGSNLSIQYAILRAIRLA